MNQSWLAYIMLGALTVAGACLLAWLVEVALTYFHFEWGGTDELIGTGMNYIHQVSSRDANRDSQACSWGFVWTKSRFGGDRGR